MAKISKVEPIVFEVLTTNKESRKDDYILIFEVLKRFVEGDTPIEELCKNHKSLGVPSIETITRCRRKLQAKNPELTDIPTEQIRSEEEQVYFEYALQ